MKRTFSRLMGVLLLFNSQGQTTVTLQCSKDAAIGYHDGANTSGNNYGGAAQNAAFVIPAYADPNGTNGNRALMDFPLNTLPPGVAILSASLNLHATGPLGVLSGHVGTANKCYVRRVTQSWQEYVVTWNNQPTATSVHQLTLQQSSGATQDYLNLDATALVQDVVANSSSSFGFQLILALEAPTNGLLFLSRDNSNPALRPTLVVTYTTCEQTSALSATPSVVCAGENYILRASATGGTPVWYNAQAPTVPISTGTSVQMQAPNVSATTVFSFQASNSSCLYLPKSGIQVTVHPLPVLLVSAPATVCAGQAATISVTGALGYSWTSPDGFVGNNPVLVVSINASSGYTVTGTSSQGCRNTAIVLIDALNCMPTSLVHEILTHPLEVFPNPSQGNCYLRNGSGNELNVEIVDVLGTRVFLVKIKPNTVFELQGLRPGVYFFNIPDNRFQIKNKLIVAD